jgi:hypothetical protein
MNEDFFHNISSTGNPIEYADTVQRYQTQLPLGISWPAVTGSLNPSDLYTDDTSLYMYYPSGLNKTALSIQQRDRYGGITFTLISGSTNLYIQASEYFADPNPAFISSPYTLSGEGGTNLINASYLSDTPENPHNYWINLPNPGTYKVVFPNPVISTAFNVTHSGSAPYVFSQMLPRKSVGSYDIDVNSIRAYHVTASFIDAVALQVSDSIVVGPDLIGAKSIDGSKIIDGTISGVLIRDGTVTGNNIFAGTISGVLIAAETITAKNIAVSGITADRISVTQLDAVAAKMGTLIVNSGITVGTNGYITVPSGYISAGKAKLDSTGLQIGSVSSVNLPSITDTLRIAGSGNSGNIVGMALYNGAFSATNPQAVLQLDSTNALELEMRTISGVVNVNFPEETLTGQFFQVYNADLYLKRSPGSPENIPPGGIYGTDSDGTVRYHMGEDQLRLNNNTVDTFVVDTATGDTNIVGTLGVVGDVGFGGTYRDLVTIQGTTGNTAILGTLNAAGGVGFGTYFDKFTVASTTGDTAIAGTLAVTGQTTLGALNASGAVGFGTSNNKLTVAAATGNTAIAGTLGVTGKFTASNLAYGTFTRTADLAITTAGTTITWQSSPRSNNVTYSTTDITVGNTGYYLITGYFATLGNVSLRMTLQRTSANYISIQQVTPLSTGGGYIFNFSNAVYLTANTVLRVILTPSANTTLNQNGETGAAPSPFLHIVQLAGI